MTILKEFFRSRHFHAPKLVKHRAKVGKPAMISEGTYHLGELFGEHHLMLFTAALLFGCFLIRLCCADIGELE